MKKPVLVIGNKNYSSWSLRPWLVLKNVGIDFTEIRIPLDTEGFKDKILQHSPAGKVPIYKENDIVVWDSLAICEYLAEKEPSLWPSSLEARSRARSISSEMHSGFPALRDELPMNCRAKNRTVSLSAAASRDVHRIIEIWESCLGRYSSDGEWLCGRFSIADAMFAPVVSRFITYGIETSDLSKRFIEAVASNIHMQQWFDDAEKEEEVIETTEVGRR